jgi:hypothetical protein
MPKAGYRHCSASAGLPSAGCAGTAVLCDARVSGGFAKEAALARRRFHALQWAVVSSAPRPLIDYYILSLHRGLRDKYYAKVARAAKTAAPAAGNGHADAKGAKAQ